MQKRSIKYIQQTFVLQTASFDCGVAALRSIIRWHGGDVATEQLRQMSGTAVTGTTMLGLFQCANCFGLTASGVQLAPEQLNEISAPFIIHTENENGATHYLVYYGSGPALGLRGDMHLVGDPAAGLVGLTAAELTLRWKSRAALLVRPGEGL